MSAPLLPTEAAILPATTILSSSHHPSAGAPPIRIGTRKSKLARVQTDLVVEALGKAWPGRTYEVVGMEPRGDRDKQTPLHEMGAKSLWTAELEVLLEKGQETRDMDEGRRKEGLDVIVHSCKGGFSHGPLFSVPLCCPIERLALPAFPSKSVVHSNANETSGT